MYFFLCCFDLNFRLENLVKTLQVNTSQPPSSRANDNQQLQQQYHKLSNGDGGHNSKVVVVGNSTVGSGTIGDGIKNTKRSTATVSTNATHKINPKWSSKQQQQQYHIHQQYSGTNTTTSTTSTTTVNLSHTNSPIKLSVAGPITDL